MLLLLQSTDPVLLSFVQSLLNDADVESVIFDVSMSVMEGSIGVFPRRVMVMADDVGRARHVLWEAGLAEHLAPAA
jgi:hypothetical protein